MTNGPHHHTCSICHQEFWCRILMECYVEDIYAVCNKQACNDQWNAVANGEFDEDYAD